MFKISLSMIVKNEEKFLEDCLLSVKEIVDEIIIVDTGSIDSTLSIAKKYNAKIFHFNWINDFSAARNFALDKVTGDWVLYLDADERINLDSRTELIKLKNEKPDHGIECVIQNIDEIKGRPSVMLYTRIFPNNKKIRFEGKIHEQIETSIRRNRFPVIKSNIKIIHLGYNLNTEDKLKKAERNLNILQVEFNQTPSSYNAFQLGQTYGILNKKVEAVHYFELSIKDKKLKNEYRSVAFRYLAVDKFEKNQLKEAHDYINNCISLDRKQPLALLVAARINASLNKKKEAVHYFKEAYDCNNSFLNGKDKSYQAILLDQKSILNEGINLALSLNDKTLFTELINIFIKNKSSYSTELKFYSDLFNNKKIDNLQLAKFVEKINKSNIEIVLTLLKYYSIKNGIIKSLYMKFLNNPKYLKEMAILAADEDSEFSEKLLERSYELKNTDASLVFYLISLKIKNNKFNEIPALIENAEKKFIDNPQIQIKIQQMKEKIFIHITS